MLVRSVLCLALSVVGVLSGCSRGADTSGPAAGGATAGGPVEVRTVRDTTSGAELPRVTLSGRPDAERRVNADLDSLSASLTCEGATPADSSYTSRVSVEHAADDVLSVSVHASYYCGGAYPTNDANLSVTYDLTTGEPVPFAALFRDYEADQAAIVGVLQSTLSAAGTEGDGGAGCPDVLSTESLASYGFAYTLSDAGLTVQPEFPHVIEACAVESLVPFESVRAFAADGGVLARVADANTGDATGR